MGLSPSSPTPPPSPPSYSSLPSPLHLPLALVLHPPSPLGSSCQVMFVLPPLSFPNGWGKISGDRGTSYVPLLLLLLSSPSSCPFSCSFPLSPCCPPVSPLVRQNFVSTVTPLKNCAKIHHPPVLECLEAHLAVLPLQVVEDGDLEVVDGLLQVALVAVGEVAGQATGLPSPQPDIRFMAPLSNLQILGGAHIIRGCSVSTGVGPQGDSGCQWTTGTPNVVN